jgi:hypothetical protein
MHDEHDDHDHDHDHDHEDMELSDVFSELDMQAESQVFLELRGQNLELLKVAAQVAGFSGSHSPLKPNDLRTAMKSIWEVYSEFYQWIDPEEDSEEDEDDEDDE